MSRRNRAPRRDVPPDPKYGSRLVTMLIRKLMMRGKASLAARILYEALDIVRERTGQDPLPLLENAVRNATPLVEVKARRVGGATYQVPVEVRGERGTSLALRWLVTFSRTRPGRTMAAKLANELIDAANETGSAIRRREEVHRMAEANKAFAHYRY
ncbi:30S ribosomal protein S7 [Synechococcus sp. R55.6]|jgi:small subunit ribosomal protein S7|uniref:Small ribosomal subunit protein uS7 n=1 Tax=Synechococcus sp. (strain JA-2-3B'a(2-13)) TaxID=321332 RepID=RS7_SYNJB|nr:30S ribosomal protein S7 [Synechococcus sp. JA-2-3B'a(2-13)]Q2JMX9.1 RecName: Full=Small ribosomal subunit protein uS7; AltName: Full=30S ribosomal protein S7 [Synechococcus sp. JA-2-3B'a(2-13)]ABD01898.1 ribosomal protein S7 [Synechococcus sp. JA-2-3B'a(2-13)]MDT7944789.1 30S ribosomal protein S7 [Cyanobacteriota bacterium PSP.bin.10]